MLLSSAAMTYMHTLHSSSQTSLCYRYMDAFLVEGHGIYSLCQSCALSHYKGMYRCGGENCKQADITHAEHWSSFVEVMICLVQKNLLQRRQKVELVWVDVFGSCGVCKTG